MNYTNDDPREVKAMWALFDSLQAAGFNPKELEIVASTVSCDWEASSNAIANGVAHE